MSVVDSGGETPGPIPNPEAKPARADGTAPGRVWESRLPPTKQQQHNNQIFFTAQPKHHTVTTAGPSFHCALSTSHRGMFFGVWLSTVGASTLVVEPSHNMTYASRTETGLRHWCDAELYKHSKHTSRYHTTAGWVGGNNKTENSCW